MPNAISDLLKWHKTTGIKQVFAELVKKLLADNGGDCIDVFPEATLAAEVFKRTGLPPGDFGRLSIPEQVVILRQALDAAKPERRRLTEPLTLKEIARWFGVHRNQVRGKVLSMYWHESVGRKIRMQVSDMPPPYHVYHTQKKIAP